MDAHQEKIDHALLDWLVESIHHDLLPDLKLESIEAHNPIVAHHVPDPWQLLGTGNYAAVLYHPNCPNWVVKVYAPGRPGFDEELEVYRRIKSHPAFSECVFGKNNFLILRRLYGITLYECIHQGIRIPQQVIHDVDHALEYAKQQGLFPHDVHGRNVMMNRGRGLVVDISDFLHQDTCSKWQNLKRAYYWLYRPIIAPLRLRVPYVLLDIVRISYRLFCRVFSRAISPRRQKSISGT